MNRRTIAALITAPILALGLVGCAEQFTFEAHPSGSGDTEEGYTGDTTQIECFTIEADSSNGDDGDRQLGEFCKTDTPSNAALRDAEQEIEDD